MYIPLFTLLEPICIQQFIFLVLYHSRTMQQKYSSSYSVKLILLNILFKKLMTIPWITGYASLYLDPDIKVSFRIILERNFKQTSTVLFLWIIILA
jgi:hypothetical protein